MELYIQRWLAAPAQDDRGTVYQRDKGTPQGGVISALLANLYLHYAFDMWMKRTHPTIGFERYADDIVIHCRRREEAQELRRQIERRLAECKLVLSQEKTKIVYCKDVRRRGRFGYTFKPRIVRSRHGNVFVGFTPAISRKASQAIRDEIRSWRLHLCSNKNLDDLSRIFNPKLRGWIQYYGKFRISALCGIYRMFQKILVKWAKNKFKHLRRRWDKAWAFIRNIARKQPSMFVHWGLGWIL
jgi:RNA-directed DNA polymerase